MATIKNVTNIDGKSAVYDFVGSSEETKPAGANIGENSTFTELDTGNQFYRKGNTWETMKAPGGGSGGGSLPANFPAEDIANAGALIGFDAEGKYAKVNYPETSQYDPLIVRMSLDDPDSPTMLVSDHTFGEIHTAAVGGKTVIVTLPGSSSATTILDCSRDELTSDITIYFLSNGTVANAVGGAEDHIVFTI